MQNIPLPNKVYFDKDEDNKSVLVMEPLYPGYGVTIGNSLRRVLLSSLPGAAVTAMKIKGADHEFSTVDGIREDLVDIALNLKQLKLKVFSEQSVKLQLKKIGPGEVKAGDIEENSDVEIFNKDMVIATLDDGAELDMELTAQQGRGYVPVEMRDDEEKSEIGVIGIDAIYSPVKNVNFEIENVRVGQITNYDKLTLTMETDGTITGQEAMDLASQILVDHFSLLLTTKLDENPEDEEEVEVGEREPENETAELQFGDLAENKEEEKGDLDTLNLSNRAANALERNGIKTVEKLKEMDREQLEGLDGLGKKSVDEILDILRGSEDATS